MDIFSEYDYEKEYECSQYIKSKHCTKLMYLVINERKFGFEVIKNYLVEHSNEINDKSKQGLTVLMIAARNSNESSSLETVKLLLDSGVDINLQNNYGSTALMWAAECSGGSSSLETVKLLLDSGADFNLQNMFGQTALMNAAINSNESSSLETVKLLLDSRANVNLQDEDRWTALIFAAVNLNVTSSLETVKLLLDGGADFNQLTDQQKKEYNLKFNYTTYPRLLNGETCLIQLAEINLNDEYYLCSNKPDHVYLKSTMDSWKKYECLLCQVSLNEKIYVNKKTE